MKRFISALLSLVMAISLLAYLPIQVEAYESVTSTVTTDWDLVGGKGSYQFNARKYLKENGTINYRAWSQCHLPWGLYKLGNNTDYATFNAWGCFVVAAAKIAVQSGNYSVNNMDPGIMNELMQKNGCFASTNGNFTNLSKIANLIGMTYSASSFDKIVSTLKADSSKQFIIHVIGKWGHHYIPVNNELTIKYGEVYIDDSWTSNGTTMSSNFTTAKNGYQTRTDCKSINDYVKKLVGIKFADTKATNNYTVQRVFMFTKSGSGTTIDPDNPSGVTIDFYSNKTAGKTGDDWLYPAFKVTVPNYKNSKISTVGYSVYTESGVEIYNFQETYRSGVNKDGTSYKNTFFGARTDGGANMDLDTDVYNIAWGYLTDARFTPGHTYKVKGFIIFDGKRYESSKFTMSTTGSKQCSWDYGKETKSPTCTSTGIRTYTCLVCGATKTETLPVKDHTPGPAATCTSPQKCTDCGTQLKAALGHNFSGSYYFSTHPHEEYQKCTRCNAEKKTGNTKKVDGCSICYPIVTFTITYNANGGTGAPSPQTKESGKALTLSSTEPTRQGYTFLGWATSSGASSAQYNAGSSFTVDANTTLYAVWRKDVVATGAQIVVGSVTAAPGSTVMVPIEIKNNPGFDSMEIFFTSSNSSIIIGSITNVCDGIDFTDGNAKLFESVDPNNEFKNSGVLCQLPVKISPSIAEGKYNIIIGYYSASNGDMCSVNFTTVDGVITVSSVMYGDVNGDGKINSIDLTTLRKYIVNRNPITGQSSVAVKAGADINGDGRITSVDLTTLRKYLVNRNPITGESSVVLGPR